VEALQYTLSQKQNACIHFTISVDHEELIKRHISKVKERCAANAVTLEVSYSSQKESTDTIGLDENGELFRDHEGKILFRPGAFGKFKRVRGRYYFYQKY